VWVAAADADDRFHAGANRLLLSARELTALDLTLYEVANAAVHRWRDADRAAWLHELVLEAAGDRLIRVDAGLFEESVAVAAREEITVYDAAYVAAARRDGLALVSADVPDLVDRGLACAPDYFR
jgi:predicted nucleic acid-binding protein